jgi:GTP-binding protein HflX
MNINPREDMNLRSDVAILVAVRLPQARSSALSDHPGSVTAFAEDPLAELRALAESAGVRVKGELIQNREKPRGKTYLGKGKVDELAHMVKELQATLVIFDNELAPSQIQELEKELTGQKAGAKIIDRSELILDIFANRASTRQAQLQVEIAQLEYTAPRLRAMWGHLGQVTGGAPVGVGTRGPGEQQLEIDRRLVQKRLLRLQGELAEVQARKTREVQERRDQHFTAGLVGYTNAGKSSIFNALTAGGAFANDQLFATLLTRVERWNLGTAAGENGSNYALLSDTVGFIRDLPHHLVASFRSTLEDAIYSHVLLIVLDVADPQAPRQLAVVRNVLDEIGATTQPRLLLLNKVDRFRDLPREEQEVMRSPEEWLAEEEDALLVSARAGDGLEELRQRVLGFMLGELKECTLSIPMGQGKAIDFIEKRIDVLARAYEADQVEYRVRLGRRQAEQLAAAPGLRIDGLLPGAAIRELFDAKSEPAARRVPPHERFAGEMPDLPAGLQES